MIEDESMEVFADLNKDEKILASFRPSHVAYLAFYIGGVLLSLTIFLAIVGIPMIIMAVYHRRGKKYYITTQRIILDAKFISKNFSSVSYQKIQDIHLTQSLGERIFGIGSIHINTAGSNAIELGIKYIKEPKKIKNLIEKHMHNHPSHESKNIDGYSELEQLHGLMKKGILTKKEFEKKKAKFLAD